MLFRSTFGVSPAGRGDIDLDGDHDFDDIGAFVQLLNAGVAGLAAVPEPSTLCLVGLAGLGVLPWFVRAGGKPAGCCSAVS